MLRPYFISIVLFAVPVFAGEQAILSSGLRLRIERHETSGGITRLFHNAGVTELPESAIVGFEPDDFVPLPIVEVVPPIAPQEPVKVLAKSARDLVHDAALRSGLPPELVSSVAKVESAFRSDAISPKGAIGVMQLMPGTAKALGADPHDPAQNIDAGARLLRELLLKYDGDVVKALAAYNAGSGAVDRFGGLPPFLETRYYVNRVIDSYKQAGGR